MPVHLARLTWPEPGGPGAPPFARASRHRCQKSNLVDPVIQPGGGIGRDDADLHRQRGHHRQRQIAMRDRTAERTLSSRPFDVDMNPLMIAGAGRKGVDAWLVYRNPIGKADFLSD